MTKPSRSFENGFAASSGGSLWVESAESSEKRTSDSGLMHPSVATHNAASVSPRRTASSPSWIAVAPEAHAVPTGRPAGAGAQRGPTGGKPPGPAPRAPTPVVQTGLMAQIPDPPAVSFRQFSLLPTPSDVTTPMPVTTTIGRPALSRIDA